MKTQHHTSSKATTETSGSDIDELAALDAQIAAMSEIMRVISTSRHDEGPVFQAILSNAKSLCNAHMAGLVLATAEDRIQRLAAHIGISPEAVDLFETGQMPVDPTVSYAAKCIVEGRLIAFDDMGESDLYLAGSPVVRSMVDDSGIRSVLFVPLLKDGAAIGLITLFREAVRAFSESEIKLVEGFATQAVIAIENVRQFREVQTRLDREQATREILSVISQNRDDETPVFRAILDRAERLCHATGSGLQLVNEARTHLLMMDSKGDDHGSFPMGFEFDLTEPLAMCTAVNEARVVHIQDLKDTELYRTGHPGRVALVDVEGVRTHLHVPLLKNGIAFGNITLSRKTVSPFSADEIALVQSFAAQAVIALENVRQFRAVQDQLAREEATGEILTVISKSRDDDARVFETVLEQAAQVCGADQAALSLITPSGTHHRLMANWGHQQTAFPTGSEWPLDNPLPAATAARTGAPVQVADLAQTEDYLAGDPVAVGMVQTEGIRSRLAVPIFHDGRSIGAISLSRREVRPFTAADIQLIERFAEHAVIAIENTRQFVETQQALARQTATADILRVISSSPGDSQPVFDRIAQSAVELCGAWFCTMWRQEAGLVHFCAQYGFEPAQMEDYVAQWPKPAPKGSMNLAVMTSGEIQHIEDSQDKSYSDWQVAREHGFGHLVGFPIFVSGKIWGTINMGWPRGETPSQSHIDLVRTFADQASIAVENTQMFNEVQTRLEREQASAEILQSINECEDDFKPVFDTILRCVNRLCEVHNGVFMLLDRDGQHFRNVASLVEERVDKQAWSIDSERPVARAIKQGASVHIKDCRELQAYKDGDPTYVTLIEELGYRTILTVPLLQEGKCLGVILLVRYHVEPFLPNEIALFDAFAAQAVIAVQNVRHFEDLQTRTDELEEALEQQTATADVLKAISQDAFDLPTVLQALIDTAARLCDASICILFENRGNVMHVGANYGCSPEMLAWHEANPNPIDRGNLAGRVTLDRKTIHIPDIQDDPDYALSASVELGGWRSIIAVPLILEGEVIGVLDLARPTVGPFSQRQIELVETFADQAVIAIKNAKLFEQVQQRTADVEKALVREQAGAEILNAINEASVDLQPVFDIVVRKAAELCQAQFCVLERFDGALNHFCAQFGFPKETLDALLRDYPLEPAERHMSPKVIASGRPQYFEDAQTDVYFAPEFAEKVGFRSLMGIPIRADGQIWGGGDRWLGSPRRAACEP